MKLKTCSGIAALVAVMAFSTKSFAQVHISGSMCNFDVYNPGPDPEDEFDIECKDLKESEIYGYYSNPNYGLPTASADPSVNGTKIVYKNPHHNTAGGGVEHFGIRTYGNSLSATNCLFQWKFNGSVPPPPPVIPPSIMPIISFNYDQGTGNITDSLYNPNTLPSQTVYVQRHEFELERQVNLNELMPANLPGLIAEATLDGGPPETELDLGLTAVGPQGTIGGEAFAANQLNDSSIIIYYDVFYYDHNVQKQLGTVISAENMTTQAVPEPATIGMSAMGLIGLLKRKRRR